GDSGGPLQVKLLHNTRITPFLVGVTSFGTACGLSVPGVYTRVAPYVPWIRTVLNDRAENATEWKFQPQACALRYAQYREYEPRVLLHKNELEESVDLSEAHLFNEVSRQQVSIHWNATIMKKECFGVIIDESTIATLAQCAVQNGLKDPIKFSKQFTPACIWERADLPESEYEVAGRGLLELNTIHVDDKDLEATASEFILRQYQTFLI
uniref:Peptidase S1 domain-containing protein n=1 Tax=Anopheles maculatus TaxID=74869 RepID=A0A182S5F1_9DIPT